jgi:CubicO group peptidase (beta-lactamase class C family)/peptidoglycan/LPS O-acetylase OafA/YrhL
MTTATTDAATTDAATTDAASTATRAGRDVFLDLLRTVALLRVVLWHATGWAAVTAVAAIPTMFFVSGSLFAGTRGRTAVQVTRDRLRRLLLPLWLFAAVSWLVMAVAAFTSGTELLWGRVLWWVLPLNDPAGSEWEGGWLSSPLWYLRALLWVLLLAPVFVRATRRAPRVLTAALAIGVVALHGMQSTGALRPSWNERLVWQLGDLALYGLFFVLGLRHRDGAFASVARRSWLTVAVCAGVGAALWWYLDAPATGVVNDAQPVHLLVGLAWLAVAMAAQEPLRRLAGHPRVHAVVRFFGQRSLTVYLWHTAALAVALAVTRRLGLHDGRWVGRYVLVALALAALAVLAFGWAEDLAARRRARLWPTRSALTLPDPRVVGAVAVGAIALFLPLPLAAAPDDSTAGAFTLRIPSQAPPLPIIEEASVRTERIYDDAPLDQDGLVQLVAEWVDHHDLPGLALGVTKPDGSAIRAAAGAHDDGTPRSVDDPIDVMSVTKLFTANLVYRQVDAGRIELDAPLPVLDALPDLPLVGQVTVRQLLSHRSGLANYRDLPSYRESPSVITAPDQAVLLTTTEVPWQGPVTEPRYSSTNFIVLGYLLEQVTGRSYDDLLREELLEPLGLARTTHLPPEPGEPRFATAGIVGGLDDLGRAAIALLRDHVGVSEASHGEMTTIDPDTAVGAGTMAYCPCVRRADDGVDVFALGYTGGTTWLAYVPEHDVALVVDVTGGVHDDHWGPVADLLQRVAQRSATHI